MAAFATIAEISNDTITCILQTPNIYFLSLKINIAQASNI